MLKLVGFPFFKDGATLVTDLTAEISTPLGVALKGETFCPEFGIILNPEAPPAGEPPTVTPAFVGVTLNPDVPAFMPEATPLVGTFIST